MSKPSIRHGKDEESSARMITALRPSKFATPAFGKGFCNVFKKYTGKENSKPQLWSLAASSQKPKFIECRKAEPRVRPLNLSIAKGRTSSPTEYTRMLSDLSKQSVPRGSLNRFEKVLICKNNLSELNGVKNLKVGRVPGNTGQKTSLMNPTGNLIKGSSNVVDTVPRKNIYSVCSAASSKNSEHRKELKEPEVRSKHNEFSELNDDMSATKDSFDKYGDGINLGVKNPGDKFLHSLKLKQPPKECAVVRVIDIDNSPNNLHQRLALLESKVQKIASDIKQTKKMLDTNKPIESRVVLSDIHAKISRIEKAVAHVLNSSDADLDSIRTLESDDWHSALGISDSDQMEDKQFSPSVEDTIAQEFLASLSTEQNSKYVEVQEIGGTSSSEVQSSSGITFNKMHDPEIVLRSDEIIDDLKKSHELEIDEETEDAFSYKLNQIGLKASTGGWFVSGRDSATVLLAHDDGSCSLHDIANCEGKAEYKPPTGFSANVLWGDCWVICAPGSDGCSEKYVVAASAGSSRDSGFCSWDFFTRKISSFHIQDDVIASRRVLGPERDLLSTAVSPSDQKWWYKPCGALIISAASSHKILTIYDIRDGEQIMKWKSQNPVVSSMEYSSPVQWKSKESVIIAETEGIMLYDVSSQYPQPLLSVHSCGKTVSSLHVNNWGAELGGGIRQRVSSSEDGSDGAFCTQDSIIALDFRKPSGVAFTIPNNGVNSQSIFSLHDSIYLGSTGIKKQPFSQQIHHYSLRMQRLQGAYSLPESNSGVAQVWGNSNHVIGVSGSGLFVFDALKCDDGNIQSVGEIIGPDDLFYPSFDYSSSRALLISRDRPALWRYIC